MCYRPRSVLAAALSILQSVVSLSSAAVPVTLAPDGAWTWFNDPRAAFVNGTLYFGFVRDGDGKSVGRSYNPSTGALAELFNSSWNEIDDHDNPGFLRRSDGRLMAFYARHAGTATTFEYRETNGNDPARPENWSAESFYNSPERITYVNPFQLTSENGRIYNFIRNLNFNPTVLYTDDNGRNWSAAKIMIQTGTGSSVRPYVKYSSDGAGRVDMLYTDGHPRDVANSLYHMYYSGGTFSKTDGTPIKSYANLPLLHDAGERGSVIYQYSDVPTSNPNDYIPTGRAWCWQVTRDSNGNPVCVFSVQVDNVTNPTWTGDRIYYFYAKWIPGSGWRKRFIAQAGRPLYSAEDDYAGGICIDPDDPRVIYISTNAARPFDLASLSDVPLAAGERYEIYRGETGDDGLSFSWQPVTSGSNADNIRPYVPANHSGYRYALIWLKGVYTSYLDWATTVQGYFGNALSNKAPVISMKEPVGSMAVLPGSSGRLFLDATVSDDGQPNPVSCAWSLVSGPAPVLFEASTSNSTWAQFTSPGAYRLTLTADDGEATVASQVSVFVGGATPTDSSLWLKLDETAGTVAMDSSGNGGNGTLTGGGVWSTDSVAGRALRLNGTNSVLTVPDSAMIEPRSAFTLSYWFKANSFNPAGAGLVSKRNAPTDNNSFTSFLQGNPSDAAYRKINVDINGNGSRFGSTTLINLGTWYHVAIVFDGALPAAERSKLYINGLLDATGAQTFASVPDFTSSLRLGLTHSGASTWFDGWIDEVRFFRRSLDPAEIAALAGTLNIAPSVSTGSAPAAMNANETALAGSVTDDGRPSAVQIAWQKVDGPGSVQFSNSSSASSNVTFSGAGNYTLRLSAFDGQARTSGLLTVNVARNVKIYDDAIALAFPGTNNQSVIGSNADPDGDGIVNLLEFALGMSPARADSVAQSGSTPGLPVVNVPAGTSDFLSLFVRRPIGLRGVSYGAEVSSDLKTWTSAVATGFPQPNSDGSETIQFRDTQPLGSSPRRFIRLRIDRNQP